MAKSVKKKKAFSVSLIDAKLISYGTTDLADSICDPINQTEYKFNFEFSFKVNVDSTIEIIVKAIIYNSFNKELGSIKGHFYFLIKDFSEVAKPVHGEPDKININPEVVTSLMGVSVSTLRGMFIMCASNSILKNAFFPIINTAQFNERFSHLEKDHP